MTQTVEIRVPDIGDFKNVPVIDVLVKPGDTVNENDSLITLESEKASMEVPSPSAGTIADVRVKVGDKVSQGDAIVTLASTNSGQSQAPAAQPPRAPQPQPAQPPQSAQSVEVRVPDIGDFKNVPVIEVFVKPGDTVRENDSVITLESEKASMEVPASAAGTVRDVRVKVGDKVTQGDVIATLVSTTPGEVQQHHADREPAPNPQPAPKPPPSAPQAPMSGNGQVHASPSIRRFARELGVDLHRVSPTGPNGRVTRDDVQGFVKRALHESAASGAGATGLAIAPLPVTDFAQFGPIERKPLSRIKKISGPALHRNWVTIPHVTQNDDADVTGLEEFRKALNTELSSTGVKITMLAFLMKAAVAALQAFPDFNSSLDGEELILKRYYHIGFAADTPGGLLVPVVRDADKKGIAELARESAELAQRARDGKLSAAEMQGGTFTISSLGSIGGTYFTPIINAPEVAILGACRASIRPVWDGNAFVPRLMQPLSLSYDHRVIDGAAAARFVAHLGAVLSDLRRALL